MTDLLTSTGAQMLRIEKQRTITACIPAQRQRLHLPAYDPVTYRQRNRAENTFAKQKGWQCNQTRYDRCADVLLAAITCSFISIFWINAS